MNDHGSEGAWCRGGSLYRIQMIMGVATMDVEHCIKYKRSCWRQSWMWKQVVVSNTNDAVGGDRGCGKRIVVSNTNDHGGDDHQRGVGSLYLIQTILWGRRWRRDNGGGKKKGTVHWFFFLYLLSFNEVICCHHVTHATMQSHATWGGVLSIVSGACLSFLYCFICFSFIDY